MSDTTAIDWAATGTMLQGIGTVVGALAVIGAAFIGSRTFDNWRRQKLAERHIDQAERILTATYKVRRSLAMVRNPVMWAHEMDAGEERLKELGQWDNIIGGDNERNRFRVTQAYYNRLAATRDDQRVLEECQPMARALFGEELEKALDILNHQFHSVRVYVDANHNDYDNADKEFRSQINRTIRTGCPSVEENEVDQIITAQIKTIEDICVPVLRLEGEKAALSKN